MVVGSGVFARKAVRRLTPAGELDRYTAWMDGVPQQW